jgi:hypothetical protein
MDVRCTLALAAALALGADVSTVTHPATAPQAAADANFFSLPAAAGPNQAQAASSAPAPPPRELQPESKLLLVRSVDGEFAKLMQSLPGGKKGFKVDVGKPIDPHHLADMLRLYGIAASQGETVLITGLDFRASEVAVEINGGGKSHFHLKDHLQVGVGGVADEPPPTSGSNRAPGGVVILDYGRPLPDMSPDDLKRDLGVMLDFSKQHSPTVNWVDSLPPQFQQAIKDQHAIVGMNQEMVVAAMGRPEHKVRERDADGYDTEDWIYGSPPGPTTFVTFSGDTVIRVKDFN